MSSPPAKRDSSEAFQATTRYFHLPCREISGGYEYGVVVHLAIRRSRDLVVVIAERITSEAGSRLPGRTDRCGTSHCESERVRTPVQRCRCRARGSKGWPQERRPAAGCPFSPGRLYHRSTPSVCPPAPLCRWRNIASAVPFFRRRQRWICSSKPAPQGHMSREATLAGGAPGCLPAAGSRGLNSQPIFLLHKCYRYPLTSHTTSCSVCIVVVGQAKGALCYPPDQRTGVAF